jgi:hypothetical protein
MDFGNLPPTQHNDLSSFMPSSLPKCNLWIKIPSIDITQYARQGYKCSLNVKNKGVTQKTQKKNL